MTAQRSNFRRLIVLLFAALIAAAIGCGGREDAGETAEMTTPAPAEAATPEAGSAPPAKLGTTNGDGPRGVVEGGLGVTRISPEQGSNSIALPADFPADVPLYPTATPTKYISTRSGRTSTTLVVDETPESAKSYYPGALESEGWEVTTNGASDELMIVSALKDGRRLQVSVSAENGVTTIKLIENKK